MKGQKNVSAPLKFNLLIRLDTVGLNTKIFISVLSYVMNTMQPFCWCKMGCFLTAFPFCYFFLKNMKILFRLSLYFIEIFIKLYGTAAFHFE